MERLDFLQRTGMVAIAGAVAQAAEPSRKLKIVTGVHPGDPEYGCGGRVARLTPAGHEVVLLYPSQPESRFLLSPPGHGGPVPRSGVRIQAHRSLYHADRQPVERLHERSLSSASAFDQCWCSLIFGAKSP